MTNKPMLIVERKLLELVVGVESDNPSTAWKELRALLDARHAVCSNGIMCQNSKCAECGGNGSYKPAAWVRDMDYRPEEIGSPEAESAAQHQGDPVAIVDESDDGLFIEFVYGENGSPLKCGDKLYAEQPAPVADHPQCEECKGWGYHENHHEGGGTERGECGGSGNATVDVVIPERMYSDSLPSWAEEQRLVRGWNACIEEVARLNGLKT